MLILAGRQGSRARPVSTEQWPKPKSQCQAGAETPEGATRRGGCPKDRMSGEPEPGSQSRSKPRKPKQLKAKGTSRSQGHLQRYWLSYSWGPSMPSIPHRGAFYPSSCSCHLPPGVSAPASSPWLGAALESGVAVVNACQNTQLTSNIA